MGTAIFMVLMVCGYWYTNSDLSSRIRIRRTSGWDLYFLVALYGCLFVMQGIVATGLLWLLLLLASAANNQIPALHISKHAEWHADLMTWSFLGLQGPVLLMLGFAIAFCFYYSNLAPGSRLDTSGRHRLYKAVSRANDVEGILLQCMEQGELAWVTLKSRRIYIGMIQTASFANPATANLVLVPMLSGYRDSEKLNFNVEHNYARWYRRHQISFTSEPRSAMSFRKVIMLDQVESISLFDPASASVLTGDG